MGGYLNAAALIPASLDRFPYLKKIVYVCVNEEFVCFGGEGMDLPRSYVEIVRSRGYDHFAFRHTSSTVPHRSLKGCC